MRKMRSMLATAIVMGLLAGSPAVVSAQEETAPPEPPVEVRGHIECGPEVRSGASDIAPAWQQPATMSDPRLAGTYYYCEAAAPLVAALPGIQVASGTRRIENDEGAWQGSMVYAYLSDGTGTTGSTVLVGEGAYEGLSAIWEQRFLFPECAADVRGLLIEGKVPAAPAPFIGE